MQVVQNLVQTHGRKGVLVDTGVLLLYVVGTCDRKQITSYKRTNTFAEEDYDTLVDILRSCGTMVTTPNILTEVSNLLKQGNTHMRELRFKSFAKTIGSSEERYEESVRLSHMPEFRRFGLADASIYEVACAGYLVLTVDSRLADYLLRKGLGAINFNHIRTSAWL